VNWQAIDKKYVWHPFSPLKEKYDPLLVTSAKGCTLFLKDGRELIDAVSSWWTNIHGHGNEELLAVLTQQALTLDHVIFAGFTHQPAAQLAQNLIQVTNHQFKKVFFSDDGSTAVEVGLKLALQYWTNLGKPKNKIFSLEGAYHGDTFGAMSLAGKSDFFKPFNSLLFEVDQLPFPTNENIESTVNTILKSFDSQQHACLVLEPLLQGSAGMRMYSKKLLAQLFDACKKANVLIVADEVLTGFGRTGDLFASLDLPIKPNIMALSKGITGGVLPLGVTLVDEIVMNAFDSDNKALTFYHGHSYTANPIACAIANKSMEILLRDVTQQNIRNLVVQQKEAKQRFGKLSKVKEARVLGTVLALEISTAGQSSYFSEIRDVLYRKAIEKGVLLRPLGNVLYVLPPYVISQSELEKVYSTIEQILNEI
jgi:adenosylmethionine---8-amino-7-oxononanoate aminotransferase